jgi:hypothetical protein
MGVVATKAGPDVNPLPSKVFRARGGSRVVVGRASDARKAASIRLSGAPESRRTETGIRRLVVGWWRVAGKVKGSNKVGCAEGKDKPSCIPPTAEPGRFPALGALPPLLDSQPHGDLAGHSRGTALGPGGAVSPGRRAAHAPLLPVLGQQGRERHQEEPTDGAASGGREALGGREARRGGGHTWSRR